VFLYIKEENGQPFFVKFPTDSFSRKENLFAYTVIEFTHITFYSILGAFHFCFLVVVMVGIYEQHLGL